MSLSLFQGAVEEGLIYAFVALGLLISYKILNIADMTTDGTFVLGAAVSSVITIAFHPVVGIMLAIVAGAIAGLVTATMQTKLGIPSILAGIITMTGLYSVNLFIQKSPNLFFPAEETVFTKFNALFPSQYSNLILLFLIVVVVGLLLSFFFSTSLGLALRATGDNIDMVQSSSINPTSIIMLGLAMSNGLVALGGSLYAQKSTIGDINIGTGVVAIGLASLVLGNALIRSNKIPIMIVATVIGSIVYRIIFAFALKKTSDAGYLKIISALIVLVVIAYPHVTKSISESQKRRRNKDAQA